MVKRLTVVKVIKTIGWSIGLALLFVGLETILGLTKGVGEIARPALIGALFGAVMGAVNQGIILRWTEGAIVGAVLGLCVGVISWLFPQTELFGSAAENAAAGVSNVFRVLLLMGACALSGAIIAGLLGKR